MDPSQIPCSSRWRSFKFNSIVPSSFSISGSPAPRYASRWDSFPYPSLYPTASDISGRWPSEYTVDSTSLAAPDYPNADNIATRYASVCDATSISTTDMIHMKDIIVPSAFNTSASLAPRNASTWNSFIGLSNNLVASDISCRRPSETTSYSSSHQKSENSNNARSIAIQKVVSSNATVDVASGSVQAASASEIARRKVKFLQRPRWDGFAEALPAYNGTTYWGSVLSSAPPSGKNRVFYAGNINYIYQIRKDKLLAVADVEAIMYIYGVENTSALSIVKKLDPNKRGMFNMNSENKQILLASTISFSNMKEPNLSILRHASKCYQDNLLSPLHFSCYIRELLEGKYLGDGSRIMLLGIYSILGVLEGSSNHGLTTKDVKKFIKLPHSYERHVRDLINMIIKNYNGTISCSSLYKLLYRRNLFGKLHILMFDNLGEQNPSMFFSLMDKGEDGFLSSTDLRRFAAIFGRYPSDEVIDRVTRKLDFDGDGKISLEDFHGTMEPILDGLTWEFWLVAILITLKF
ncbi:uncharacterized protein LOC110731388 [Chenopodium quinoa]|uniref:EF-hand domain-containing protein n=1 Tax=Chenopodium quinoa TaxID=63459 RepID=A0A803M226_CHEQI|nr:uncharacterized protein LOC110731388 [Chenopodium quinoa]